MPKFAANLTYMFPELEPKCRFSAAAKAGFKTVEILRPYDLEKNEVKALLNDNGLQFLLLNTRGETRIRTNAVSERCREERRISVKPLTRHSIM